MTLDSTLFSIVLFVLGPFLGFYVTKLLERHQQPKISKARQTAIAGEWVGVYNQDKNDNRDAQSIAIKIMLAADSRSITGSMTVKDMEQFEFKIEGLFYHNRYLRLNYMASGDTENAIDFGTVFLVLGAFPNRMVGKLVGYGSISESIISGSVEFTKNLTLDAVT